MGGELGIDNITEFATRIYRTGQVPDTMKKLEFLTF